MKKTIFILLIITVFSLLSLADILIEPSRYTLEIVPGEKQSGAITVINTSTIPVHLKAVLYDWDLSEDGELIELNAETLDDTLNGLIKFNPREFTVNPGKSQIVRFTIQAPVDSLEHKGIVFFEHTTNANAMIGATVTNKIGTTLYVTTPNVEMSLSYRNIDISVNDQQVSLLVGAENIGKGHIRLLIDYVLQTKEGKSIKKETIPDQVLLAGKTLDTSFPIESNLDPGDYRLILTLSYAGYNQSNQGILEFSIP